MSKAETGQADYADKDPDLTPDAVVAKAGLDEPAELAELTDRQLAYFAWQLIKSHSGKHFLATFDGEIYVYEDGIWVPEGEQRLGELGAKMLGPEYGRNVKEELIERVQSEKGHRRTDLGAPNRSVVVENGLLRLMERETEPHDPEHQALNKIPYEYHQDAECPRWRQFLEESVEDGKVDALQEYVGYTLLEGELPLARALLLVGGGSNGKSTFLNTVAKLLGEDNVTGFSLGNLAHNEYYAAEMWGALANIDADVTGGIGHGGMFKKLTGGDRAVNARRPYGEPFTFHPTTKQLYSANEVPDTKVDDDAFFRRWLIIEFPVEFTDSHLEGPNKDENLEEDLENELPGILAWAVDGLNRLLDQGRFTNEGEIHEKRERWQEWGDTVDKFVSRCVDLEGDGKHKTGYVHDVYVKFCRDELDDTPESQSTLTSTLKKEAGVSYSDNYRFDGVKARGFKGFALTCDEPEQEKDGDEQPQTQQSLSQSGGYETVKQAVSDLAGDDGLADVEDVLDQASGGALPRHKARHYVDQLLDNRTLYEPEDGRIGFVD